MNSITAENAPDGENVVAKIPPGGIGCATIMVAWLGQLVFILGAIGFAYSYGGADKSNLGEAFMALAIGSFIAFPANVLNAFILKGWRRYMAICLSVLFVPGFAFTAYWFYLVSTGQTH